eukprot:CAMPEP_0177363250 /NCGR_PEP_ID=MMETSP0368-20130122/38147_1 /TAXON_ID=447022 ORGANISM="Scrippsiella hangoei-like, Strain SHHI-4" /NCGR_SAMPLE_ID=MMETSP0368 /ASSEMBLY_ACC=CAM_ASM_000363 /LENGTH=113 /DNA_ID=CAMNT_0018826013 /DNA_START=327 /DNA_END=669 /DNA_ORIENTATION=-
MELSSGPLDRSSPTHSPARPDADESGHCGQEPPTVITQPMGPRPAGSRTRPSPKGHTVTKIDLSALPMQDGSSAGLAAARALPMDVERQVRQASSTRAASSPARHQGGARVGA